jgi:hypothetical protein
MIRKDIVIDAQGERKPFRHFYRAAGYANADYTCTPPGSILFPFTARAVIPPWWGLPPTICLIPCGNL